MELIFSSHLRSCVMMEARRRKESTVVTKWDWAFFVILKSFPLFFNSQEEEESEEEGEDPTLDSLSQAIAFQVSNILRPPHKTCHTITFFKSFSCGLQCYDIVIAHYTILWSYSSLFLLSFLPHQQARIEEEETNRKQARLSQEEGGHASTSSDSRKPRIKKSAYFSDEEELSD